MSARHGSIGISREESERSKVKIRSKRQLIVRYHRNSPEMTAKQIASVLKTTEGYVYNVWNKSEVERPRGGHIFGVSGHGRMWYENAVLVKDVERLRAVVVNTKTGMKQIGFKKRGDPCSCQVHSNGKVIIFPHGLAWRPWLIGEFQKAGWDSDLASLVVDTTYLVVKELHGAARVPKDFIPHDFYAKTDWGVVVVRDTSPYPNTFEMKLIVPDMQKYLGLPEIQQQLKALEQGSVTMNQALRAILTVLARQNREIYDIKGEVMRRTSGPSTSLVSPTSAVTLNDEKFILPVACRGCTKKPAEVEMCRIHTYTFKLYGRKCPKEGEFSDG